MKPYKVLIVDDDVKYLRSLADELDRKVRRRGLEVLKEDNPKRAMQCLKEHASTIAVILIDIALPVPKECLKFLQKVQEQYPGVKRIVMTGQASRETVAQLGSLGLMHGYIEKGKNMVDSAAKEIKRVMNLPCPNEARSHIVSALRAWLKRDPSAGKTTIEFLDRGSVTLEQISHEMEKGTEFGKSQERIIYRLATDLFLEQAGADVKS